MKVIENGNVGKFIGYTLLVCMLLLILQVVPAMAVYDYAGIPLTNDRHETLNGGVYIDGGYGLDYSPYSQAFTVPSGTIRYAKLYVGVWGGNNVSTGNISTEINSVDLGSISLLGENDLNSNVYVSGSGVYWASYNVTDHVTSGSNTATSTTNGTIDGRVYGIVLVAVYENASMPQVEYWINEGNEYLNSKTQDNTATTFNGTVGITEIESAKLWTSYIGGSAGNDDTLSMNGNIVAADATDGAEGSLFDLDEWNVTDVLVSSNNSVEFDRVNDTSLFPVSTVLVVTRKSNGYFGDKPLTIYKHEKINGDVDFTLGNSSYTGGLTTGSQYPVESNVTIPPGSSVKLARLYTYWTWSKNTSTSTGVNAEMQVTFDGTIVPPDSTYTDRKGYGTYDYPYGTYAYNVTDLVTATGNYTTVVENVGVSKSFSMYGVGLLVVLENASGQETEYWIAEGADILYSKDTYGTTPELATSYIDFDGAVNTATVKNATLISVVQGATKGDTDMNELVFNSQNWIGALDAPTAQQQIAVDTREVSGYLQSGNNMAGIRDRGDSMMAVGSILKITYEKNGYTGDNPLTMYRHDKINGELMYSLGNSTYTGGLATNDVYPVGTEITIPAGYNVSLARLYTYWTWSKDIVTSTGIDAEMEVTFDGNIIATDKNYSDRKGFGTYDYPYGTYAYNVTDFVTSTKNYTTVVENIGTNKSFSMYGVGLLIVFENATAEEIEYWIAEGADIIYSKDTYGTTPESATTYVDFDGSVDTNAVKNATLVSVVQGATKGDTDMNELIFNSQNWIGALDAPTAQQQIAVDTREVNSYLQSGNNMAGIRDRGDSMMAVNTFLVLNFTPTLTISASPTSVDVGVPTGVTFTVTDNGTPVEGAVISLSGSATGSGTTDAQGTATISINATGEGTITATATKDGISGSTTITASPQSDSSSVSLSATIVPAISLVVTPGTLDFGMLSVGETSSVNTLSLDNQGGYDISVTTDVTDTANDLFVDGIMLNSASWNSYNIFMAAHTSTTSNVALQVPNNYIGIGAQQGTLIFWAQQA